jgi:comEA protein
MSGSGFNSRAVSGQRSAVGASVNPRERTVLVFLIGVLLIGAGINAYRRVRRQRQLATIVIVPRSGSSTPSDSQLPIPDTESPAPDTEQSTPSLIDLNTATPAELDLLPGIGPALSQRIIDYRKANHGFRSIEELRKVSGIGPKKYAAIKDRVSAGPLP